MEDEAAAVYVSDAVWYSVLQCIAVRCSVLQSLKCIMEDEAAAVYASVAACYSLGAECCSVLQRVAACCSVLQCVAACFSVLQCVAVCCSVLQCEKNRFDVVEEQMSSLLPPPSSLKSRH